RTFGGFVVRGRKLRYLRPERPSFLLPLDAPAVEQFGVGESEQLEHPESVCRPPVVLVAVKEDGRILVDPLLAEKFFELLRRHVVAQHRIVEVEMPVHLLCAGDVPGVVEENILVAFDDSDVRIVEMLGEPFRAYENLRMHVTLAGDRRIDGGSIGSDCRPHSQLLKEESYCIIRSKQQRCKWNS